MEISSAMLIQYQQYLAFLNPICSWICEGLLRVAYARRSWHDICQKKVLSRPISTSGRAIIYMPGIDAINKRVSNEHRRASALLVNSVEYQICKSFKDRMFIMVSGVVTLKAKQRKFLQFFYVARCQDGSYVIFNDILRYVDVTPQDALESLSHSAAKTSTDVELIPFFMVKKGNLLTYFNNIDTPN